MPLSWRHITAVLFCAGLLLANDAPKSYYDLTLVVSLDRDQASQAATLLKASVKDKIGKISGGDPMELKNGQMESPTPRGTLRHTAVTVWRVHWTPEQRAAAAAVAKSLPDANLDITPASDAGMPPPTASRTPAERLRKLAFEQLGFLPPSLTNAAAAAAFFDQSLGHVTRELTAVSLMTGRSPSQLLHEPVVAAAKVHANPRFKAFASAPPSLTGSTGHPFEAEFTAAAVKHPGVTPEMLQALMFASRGYEGGFASSSGLYGIMGLGRATAKSLGVDPTDPAQSIDGAARLFASLQKQFSGDLSRSAAAFYCGTGVVRRSGGIPRACTDYLGQFRLAYQNGVDHALNAEAPRRPPEPAPSPPRSSARETPRPPAVSPPGTFSRLYDDARVDLVSYISGDTSPNDPDRHLGNVRKIPMQSVPVIRWAAERVAHVDPDVYQALVWAEGGATGAQSSQGAKGYAQITRSGSASCTGFSWEQRTQDMDINIACGAYLFAERSAKLRSQGIDDPVLALAMYNTRPRDSTTGADTWGLIATRRRVPAFNETVAYVSRIARYTCELSGKHILNIDTHIPPNMQSRSRRYYAQAAQWIQAERASSRQAAKSLRPECESL